MRASLSIDLDNEWSYLKTHGDADWEAYPTYLGTVIPRFVELMRAHGVRATAFVVGQDAALPRNAEALAQLAPAGHEIGNHSFHHEPWLPRYSPSEIDRELQTAHEAIATATGHPPRGFRAPGYAVSDSVIDALVRMGYAYDASSLPTFIGPLARAYYFRGSALSADERAQREALFGAFSDGFRQLGIHRIRRGATSLDEIPVTTFPALRIPIHFSYVLALAAYAPALARAYFELALTACKLAKIGPSLLLHPLDLLDANEVPRLRFFPGMAMPHQRKAEILDFALRRFRTHFDVVSIDEHRAAALAG